MARTLAEWAMVMPWLKWDEPVCVTTFQNPTPKRYACRVCLANNGLKGSHVKNLPTDPAVVYAHIKTEHMEAN